MKKGIILAVLATVTLLFSTEARVESMGSNPDFIKDDISIFDNPASAFEYGNHLVGSLGSMENQENGTWVRKDEWFGGWAIYKLNDATKLTFGATLNRPFEIVKKYNELDNSDFFYVNNGDNRFNMADSTLKNVDILDAVNMPDLMGNVYLFTGVNFDENLSLAIGARYAGNEKSTGVQDKSSMSVTGGNLGILYRIDKHSLEASINIDNFALERIHTYYYGFNDTAKNKIAMSYDETNVSIGMRFFYIFTPKTTLVPVVSFDKTSLLGIKRTDLGVGIGLNKDLYKGFIWTGMKYIYHSATYPDQINNTSIYPNTDAPSFITGVTENSHKLVYSFGVEKKMLWDWFTLRVGGNKVFEYLTKEKNSKTFEKSLVERDVDAVAWGIALGSPDDRLMFDITISEAFPYSNIFSGGEDGVMLTRIAAALKF